MRRGERVQAAAVYCDTCVHATDDDAMERAGAGARARRRMRDGGKEGPRNPGPRHIVVASHTHTY